MPFIAWGIRFMHPDLNGKHYSTIGIGLVTNNDNLDEEVKCFFQRGKFHKLSMQSFQVICAFYAMLYNGIKAAPVWNGKLHKFVGEFESYYALENSANFRR